MAAAKAEISLSSGLRYLPGRLSREEQENLVETIRGVVTEAPLYVPVMPGSGRPMSVRMTNCGPLGWVTDKERGYRYQPTHPMTGKPWPAIPQVLLDLWRELSAYPKDPEACLVNFYADDAKMGLHQDRDETEFAAPVLSISLGNTCLFRIGGLARSDRTQSLKLESGDVFLLGGEGRLCFHGVDRIYPATSTLLKSGGRINLTLRRVNP
ncbi:MAG: alpha-ketoglutarate-dependent dioxygenase AlkB family protein [Allorhizobium sp.]|jgi:alkylated DNA repair protein (DNA oxidative demethylase)|uniref:Alpha-ketoglutarate-dependent dioxygenase AlkB n=1 Tax=Rhizobium rosettiformans TaxID=1368430 RepID=A0ABX7ERU2_9HYPH|nr:alpha-ketoglutarate-dependent dioxygenase AlkB [Rhizobium rosettiformans]ODS54044.1 MAG: alkylated DNA repair dioxygenase [Agrobacterium sp. SCN 61-19]QRF51060.1 alpha-ketoglutarate-dependent dioxygenase AlkB [Rhizobium rosettiformans]